jgi:cytoskeletal protein RodZ
MVFETKKIQNETLGEYLKSVRENLKLTPAEVSLKTDISLKFLGFLESGLLYKLPPDVYVFGFLKKIALLYGVEPEVLLDQYKKERGISVNIQKTPTSPKSKFSSLFKNFVVTPKILTFVLGFGFIVLTLVYIVWQVWSINRTPNLELFEPADKQLVEGSFVNVKGKTAPGIRISVNQNENVFVDTEGKFTLVVGVSPGPNEIVIVAKNKFDKSVTKKLTVIGKSNAENLNNQSVELYLEFLQNATVKFSVDGNTEERQDFKLGDKKTLQANSKIVFSVDNAGAVKAVVNGKDLGLLGREGEPLNNVTFSSESVKINQ